MSWLGKFVELVRVIDRLTHLESKHGGLIDGLTTRVTTLETREAIVITESRAAASTAASAAASIHIADLARRQGALEERVKALEARRHGPE